MEMSHPSDAECRTLVIRMLRELSEDSDSTNKSKAEVKDTLIEMSNQRESG